MFQALKAKASGKQATSLQFDILVDSISSLPAQAGTPVYVQWKRKNKVRTEQVLVGPGGSVSVNQTLVDVASMMKRPGAEGFDDKVGELAIVGPNGVIGSAEVNLAQFATLNVGGTSNIDIVQLRSKRSLAGEVRLKISSMAASLVKALNPDQPSSPQSTPTGPGVEELKSQIEQLQDELDEETAHSNAMNVEVQRLLAIIRDLEGQLLDSDGAMLAVEERKASAMRLMAKFVQNSIADQARWSFTTWRLFLITEADKRLVDASAARAEELISELQDVKSQSSMTKADLALKKLQFGALATGFATWKDMTTVAKHMRLLDDTAGVNRLKDLKDPIQKIEYILQKWQMKDIVSALSIWKNQYRQYYLEQVVFSEQIFARQEICDQRYRVIMRQWKSASQAKAVANWRQKVLEDRAARAASGGVAGKNKHNYEVLCKRILRLDSSIFECHVSSLLLWYRAELRRAFGVWQALYMSRSHHVWEMRSGLQRLRTKAAGSFVKMMESFEWRVRTGALQKAWGLWRSFLIENMMTMHQAMVEKLWSRNQAQATELESMRHEVQFGRSLGTAIEENIELKKANKMLSERASQMLTHSEDMAGSINENVAALRSEVDEWKNQALEYQQECESLKEATLEEQSDFLELFARLAERCVNERESALKAVVAVFSRYSLSEGFLHWSRLVANKQLNGSLQLVDVANSQLRDVITKVSNEQMTIPKLQMELDAANRDREQLRATVERNMAYTQALISNLNFLKSALPAHVTQELPNLSSKIDAARSSFGAAKSPVSLEDILQPPTSGRSVNSRYQ